jgi:hypothetical protein
MVCLVAALYFLWRIVKLHRAEPAMWDKLAGQKRSGTEVVC